MKNTDDFWKRSELIFQKQCESRKMVLAGYAVSFICIAIGLMLMCLVAWRHQEFSGKSIETPIVLLITGAMGFIFCFFRNTASVRVKFYSGCLVLTVVSAYMLIFHPEATAVRYPNPRFNRAIDIAGIVFFGGLGLWVLYNDCRWHLYHKK